MIVKVDGQTINFVKQGITFTEKLSEELDTGLLMFYSSTIAEPIKPFSLVEITHNEKTLYFYVSADECILQSKLENLYQHTVVLVEITKKLEKIIVENISFTQPTDGSVRYTIKDAIERIHAITPVEVESLWTDTRLFDLDSNMLSTFQNTKLPQLVLENKNFMEVFHEILKTVNCFPYMENEQILSYVDLNKQEDTNFSSDYNISKGLTISEQDYIGKITTKVENGINERSYSGMSEVFPDEFRYFTFRPSGDMFASTQNLILQLPNDIYRINDLFVAVRYIQITPVDAPSDFRPMEIIRDVSLKDCLFEKKFYDLLEVDSGTHNKSNSLYYSQYDNKIYGFGNSIPNYLGFSVSAFEKIINDLVPQTITYLGTTLYVDNIGGNTDVETSSVTGKKLLNGEYGFRVYYEPIINTKINVYKDGVQDSKGISLYINQSLNKVVVNNFLDNIKNTINRTGNVNQSIEKIVSNLDDAFKVGQKFNDYIVSEVSNQILNDETIKSTAEFVKNYNKLSQFVGINTEERQYPVLLQPNTERDIIYDEFVVFDVDSVGDSTSFLTTNAKTLLKNTFSSSAYNNDPNGEGLITSAFVQTKDSSNLTRNFLLDLTKTFSKNSTIFYFKFEDNLGAYRYLSTIKEVTNLGDDTILEALLGDHISIGKSYSYNTNGEFEKMTVRMLPRTAADFNIETIKGYCWPYSTSFPTDSDATGKDCVYMFSGDNFFTATKYFTGTKISVCDIQTVKSDFYLGAYSRFRTLPFNAKNPLNSGGITFGTNYLLNLENLIVKKDIAEKISFSYQMNFISKSRKIIMGLFSSFNRLASYDRLQLYLYISNSETLKQGDTKVKGFRLTNAFAFTTEFLTGNQTKISVPFIFECYNILMNYNGNPSATQTEIDGVIINTLKSWSIGNIDGDLYFGVNPEKTSFSVYFNTKNKL